MQENKDTDQACKEARQELAKSLKELYDCLVEESKPLGSEFQQVLDNNLWDLYE